jgi:hypothetical protein
VNGKGLGTRAIQDASEVSVLVFYTFLRRAGGPQQIGNVSPCPPRKGFSPIHFKGTLVSLLSAACQFCLPSSSDCCGSIGPIASLGSVDCADTVDSMATFCLLTNTFCKLLERYELHS